MKKITVRSWGNQQAQPNNFHTPWWRDELIDSLGDSNLACGNLRSYGDSCLSNNTLISCRHLNRFIEADFENGSITVEAGISLKEILDIIVPRGWFLPVVPGTQFVTVGGAIANDIHGKNHHHEGTFGCHVTDIHLLRSDKKTLICSQNKHPELFAATIGGLGLTGIITIATLKLKPIASPFLEVESKPFYSLNEFYALNAAAEKNFEYTVSWIDSQSEGQLKGIFICANFTSKQKKHHPKKAKSLPVFLPGFFLNSHTVKLFNQLYFYFNKNQSKHTRIQHYSDFFFPLDSIHHWNKAYGKKGFYQYQCVLPMPHAKQYMSDILNAITASKLASFLSVLKTFGDKPSPGLLSFPQPGITLALDFSNKGEKTTALFKQLNRIVEQAGGRIYPAKDAQMNADLFHKSYSDNINAFTAQIDPKFSSTFWQRVNNHEQ